MQRPNALSDVRAWAAGARVDGLGLLVDVAATGCDDVPMNQVSEFCSGPGGLVAATSFAWETAGLSPETLRPADLAPVDEFHIRGRAASLEIIEALGVTANAHVLDLGSGLGGPARTLAELTGWTVTGVGGEADEGDLVQGLVRLPVAAAVEAVPVGPVPVTPRRRERREDLDQQPHPGVRGPLRAPQLTSAVLGGGEVGDLVERMLPHSGRPLDLSNSFIQPAGLPIDTSTTGASRRTV